MRLTERAQLALHRVRVPVVLHGVVGASLQLLRDIDPLVPVLLLRLDQRRVLFLLQVIKAQAFCQKKRSVDHKRRRIAQRTYAPRALPHGRVELVLPALAALLALAPADLRAAQPASQRASATVDTNGSGTAHRDARVHQDGWRGGRAHVERQRRPFLRAVLDDHPLEQLILL